MIILSIETSCDETSFAIVRSENDHLFVEQNLVASQIDLHAQYGGVVPELAARQHTETLIPLLTELGIARDGSDIDVIAVTAGPGLVPALRIGVACAATLALLWDKPLVATNHLEGHLYSCWLSETTPSFPAIGLLVSGGHSEIILMKDHGDYGVLGMTRDDAAGEAFDKVAKILGLGYPGGPIVSKKALEGDASAIPFPRPMQHSQDYDFSFSGLKTAVAYHVKEHPEDRVEDVCASFQEAVVDTLVSKTLKAVKAHRPASVFLSGGVSANKHLRNTLETRLKKLNKTISFHAPELSYTTDNAAMIAAAAYHRYQKGDTTDPLTLIADPNLRFK